MVSVTRDNLLRLPYPIFCLISLQKSTNSLQEDREPVSEDETIGRVNCLASAGMVALARGTTFFLYKQFGSRNREIPGVASATKCLGLEF